MVNSELRLRSSSLYANGRAVFIEGDTEELYRNEVEWQGNINDRVHTIRVGETAMSIAQSKYSNEVENAQDYFFLIMDANKELENPLDLSENVGQQITIPNIPFYKLTQI